MILELLEIQGEVEVAELANRFATSTETIRRDLREMEKDGLLTRTHGGAVIVKNKHSNGYEYPLLVRGLQKYEEKQMICRATAPLLEDGDTIFLDNSSTTMHLLKYIPRNIKITIITNSIQVLLEAGKINNGNMNVISVGGIFNSKNYSLFGPLSNSFVRSFYPDKAIMSCRGIDRTSGLTDASIYEIEVKQVMIEHSRKFILMADYTKFGLVGAIHLCGLEEIDVLVTDSKVDREELKMFDELQTEIIIAE